MNKYNKMNMLALATELPDWQASGDHPIYTQLVEFVNAIPKMFQHLNFHYAMEFVTMEH